MRLSTAPKKRRVLNPPFQKLVEPMGVEPTASRVRFQNATRHYTDTTRKASQFKTHVAKHGRLSQGDRHATAPVLGQKADSATVIIGVAPLIAYLMVCSNPKPHQRFSIAVRELSVSFMRRRKWKNKRSAHGAAMNDARIARQIHGQNCGMVVVSAGQRLSGF
jgi:hypothetical protein